MSEPKPKGLSAEVKERILASVSLGVSVRKTLERKGMPTRHALTRELRVDPAFAAAYLEARRVGIEWHIDAILELADSATAENYNAIRLQVDTRKWIACKLVPKIYGDRVEVDAPPPAGYGRLDLLEVAREIAWTLRRADGAVDPIAALLPPPAPAPPPLRVRETRRAPPPTGEPSSHPGAAFQRDVAAAKSEFTIGEWSLLTGENFYGLPPERRPHTVLAFDERDDGVEMIVEPIDAWRERTQQVA